MARAPDGLGPIARGGVRGRVGDVACCMARIP